MSIVSASPRRHKFRAVAIVLASILVTGLALIGVSPAHAEVTVPTVVAGAPAGAGSFVDYNGTMYLSAQDPSGPYNIVWTYDGTTFAPLAGSPNAVTQLTVFGGKLLITAVVDISVVNESTLYSYDGTSVTHLTSTFVSPNGFLEFNGLLYFIANDGSEWHVWSYDGTSFSVLTPTASYTNSYNLSSFGGSLYFTGDPDSDGTNDNDVLFKWDPTASTATPVTGSPLDPSEIATLDGVGYIGASGSLYSFDGTTFTQLVTSGTNAGTPVVFDGTLYYNADDGTSTHLYSYSNGTSAPVANSDTETSTFFEYDNSLFFLGLTSTTTTLKVLAGGVVTDLAGSPGYAFGLMTYNGTLYFTGLSAGAEADEMFSLSIVPTVPKPALAATGVDPMGTALSGAALLALGVLLAFGIRRRRTLAA